VNTGILPFFVTSFLLLFYLATTMSRWTKEEAAALEEMKRRLGNELIEAPQFPEGVPNYLLFHDRYKSMFMIYAFET
jgi:hypothetical protein